MKVQIQQQALRIRIDEAELCQLLAGGQVQNHTTLPAGICWVQRIALHASANPCIIAEGTDLEMRLPRTAVDALQSRLPSRDGLKFEMAGGSLPLTVQFDVDVRDSLRQRGVGGRAKDAAVSPA